jgi:hypothetical protein
MVSHPGWTLNDTVINGGEILFLFEPILQGEQEPSIYKTWSLEDSENLPAPEVLAMEIVENLEAALDQFRGIVDSLERSQKAKE